MNYEVAPFPLKNPPIPYDVRCGDIALLAQSVASFINFRGNKFHIFKILVSVVKFKTRFLQNLTSNLNERR